jgi:hypothetical protein
MIGRLTQRSSYCLSKSTTKLVILKRFIQRSDDKATHSVQDHVVEKTPMTAMLWQMRKQLTQHENSIDIQTMQQTLLTKTTEESRLTLSYNFTKDSTLRDLYVDHTGNILIGKILEDMDALAGNVAHSHCDDHNAATRRLALVTASVDEIVQRKPISIRDDIILTGNIVKLYGFHYDVHCLVPS